MERPSVPGQVLPLVFPADGDPRRSLNGGTFLGADVKVGDTFGMLGQAPSNGQILPNGVEVVVREISGALYTLVPIRPRRRGERRSLRTLPGISLRPPLVSIPDRDAFQLQLTPFNSTPTFARMERPSSPGSGATSFASSPTRPRTSAARSGSCCRSSPGRTCGAC